MQALKFESAASDQRSTRSTTSAISYDDSGLSDFLIGRGVKNLILGNRLYWYLMVEVALEDKIMAKMYGRVVYKFMKDVEVCLLPCPSETHLILWLSGRERQRTSGFNGTPGRAGWHIGQARQGITDV